MVAVLLLGASPAGADDWPFETPGGPVTREVAPDRIEPPAAPLAIRAYRAAARFQGPRCRHRPSCSAYAASALHRFGPVLGSFVGAARLLRGERSSALRPLPRDAAGHFLDPLEASTFFLMDVP